MSLLQKIRAVLFISLIAAVLLPFGSLSADQPGGTVIISVQDENGAFFSGDWHLHQGTTINGSVVRNGSAGEEFQADSGSYFLEIRSLLGSHPYYVLYSENPQFVPENENITFSVQYFKTEEAMLIASGNPAPEPPAPEADEGGQGADYIDNHGCNNTQGYLWCESDQVCTKFWSLACKVDESEEAEEVVETPEPVVAPIVVNTAPAQYVPSFDTPPVVPEPEVLDTASAEIAGIQLAQTGPSAMLALLSSMLVGLALIRRKD